MRFLPDGPIPVRASRIDPARSGRGVYVGQVRKGEEGYEIQPGPGPRWWSFPVAASLTERLAKLVPEKGEIYLRVESEWVEFKSRVQGEVKMIGAHRWRVEKVKAPSIRRPANR